MRPETRIRDYTSPHCTTARTHGCGYGPADPRDFARVPSSGARTPLCEGRCSNATLPWVVSIEAILELRQ